MPRENPNCPEPHTYPGCRGEELKGRPAGVLTTALHFLGSWVLLFTFEPTFPLSFHPPAKTKTKIKNEIETSRSCGNSAFLSNHLGTGWPGFWELQVIHVRSCCEKAGRGASTEPGKSTSNPGRTLSFAEGWPPWEARIWLVALLRPPRNQEGTCVFM